MFTTAIVLSLVMARQDWYSFEPEARNFRIEMPHEPNTSSKRPIKNVKGLSQLTSAESITTEANYLIQVTEQGRKVDPNTLDDGIRQFVAAKKATLGAVGQITVAGYPGRDFEMTEHLAEGEKRSKMRWVVSGNALFMLTVSGNPGAELPGDVDQFFGSLEIGNPKVTDRGPAKPAPTEVGHPNVAERPTAKAAKVEESDTVIVVDESGDDKAKDVAKPSPKSAKPKSAARITISRLPRNAKSYPEESLQNLDRSFERDREGFRDVGPAGSVLVGFQMSFIERFGGPKVRSVQPIFRSATGTSYYLGRIHGEVAAPVVAVVAKPGYIVGGIETHSGLMLDGFNVLFVKVDGDRLDPNDSYMSPWIGDPNGGGSNQMVSTGTLVVGIHGKANAEIKALALTTLK